jgi:hypothetical protein
MKINSKGLNIDQMQCFVQGSNCKLNIIEQKKRELTVSLAATTAITNRRRTLYTLTVPDSAGNWHWYSHLWINPSIK